MGDDHKVWDLVAHYIAICCMNITLLSSPEVIVIGGGVMNRAVLFPKIRTAFFKMMNGYIIHERMEEQNLDQYIVKSKFGYDSGLYSAFALA